MSTSNDSSKAELNIQIHSPVRRNESTKERLFGRQSSFSSDRLDLTSNDVSFAAGKNTWWIWGGSKYSGVLCMVISSVAYSFMGLFVKLLSVSGVPSSETVLCRCAVVAILAGAGLKKMRHPLLGSPKVRRLVLARAIVGYFALSTYFYSIQLLPLRDATVLNFTMPIFTAILAALLLNERWGLPEAVGTFFGFLGVVLVSQPHFIFPGGETINSTNTTYVGIVAAILGSSLGALSYIIVRAVGRLGEPPLVCVFAFAAMSVPFSAVAMFFQGLKVPSPLEAAGLLMVGLTAFTAQVFLTRGLQLENAAKASALQYLKVICTYLLGVAFLGETPSLVSLLGALFIAGSAFSLTQSKG
ncbi:hypothetical protein M758_6G022500 [Ceratodon purpureus]|uniref:EamA domain-containing protein n=1 Tax=Ceratodon purpureus TaxID=3225 RepID=A0A8T0HCY2_CERPU|nr:hypothetical protein KC19_6G025200 [Ceratodon purpureus]KAG0612376.1 hypothetical protein M758_6G022500 [Ceratodon purpureus]